MTADPLSSPASPPPRRRRTRRPIRLGVLALVAGLLVALGVWTTNHRGSTPTASVASRPGAAGSAATASYALLDGRSADLAALRGQRVLVWFVAAGCASCAASIPAVAQHLAQFTRTHTEVLVLGLYGAFGDGPQASAALASFGKAAAGPAFTSPAWTWGLASEQLTGAYDPDGVPDAYYLLDPTGRVTYSNSVPLSTMGALLAQLSTGATTAGSPGAIGAAGAGPVRP